LTENRNTEAVSVILFCKAPVPGRVKTRLAADFAGAVGLYASLLDFLIRRLEADDAIRLYLSTDSESLPYFIERYPDLPVLEQQGDDLGKRMQNAFAEVFSAGKASTVILAGSDVPEFTPFIACRMADLCRDFDAVILPSSDGGYAAICLKKQVQSALPVLFADIPWSTSAVLEKQMQRLCQAGLRAAMMPEPVDDIDVLEDLLAFRKRVMRHPASDWPFLKQLPRVVAILPVLNEAESLPLILPSLLQSIWIDEVVCVDNGSSDPSSLIIERSGATLLQCRRRGYGAAMLTGIDYVCRTSGSDTILLFMDADGSDDRSRIADLLRPILAGTADFVLGARQGGLLFHQKAGNLLAVFLIRLLWKHSFADLGPYRAIRLSSLLSLRMDEQDFGWTIQMQIRAIERQLKTIEIPVAHLKRLGGRSKVSGTVRGTVLAGTIILRTIFREWLRRRKGFTFHG
jgi:rSAM/selenodomain-associated transferase 1